MIGDITRNLLNRPSYASSAGEFAPGTLDWSRGAHPKLYNTLKNLSVGTQSSTSPFWQARGRMGGRELTAYKKFQQLLTPYMETGKATRAGQSGFSTKGIQHPSAQQLADFKKMHPGVAV